MPGRYVLDTNIYIQCMLDREFSLRHQSEYSRRIPFTFFCSVVVQELLFGCIQESAAKRVHAFYKPFERVNRIITPLYHDWKEAGVVGGKVIRRHPSLKTKRHALINDILIALCCRRIGATLITQNLKGFQVISTIKPVRFEIWE